MKEDLLKQYRRLKNFRSPYREKCLIDLSVYSNTYNLSLDDFSSTVGLYKSQGVYDTSIDISLNIVKSSIDTLVSLMKVNKVRPFLNTIRGNYKDVLVARNGQRAIDRMIELTHLNEKISEAFRHACIFDMGWVDTRGNISVALPWCVYFDVNEMTYNKKLTRIFYERKNYPVNLLEEKYRGMYSKPTCTFTEGWDLNSHEYCRIFDNGEVYIEDYKYDDIPLVYIPLQETIVGGSTESLVDQLLAIQIELNLLMNKIKDASQLSPANTVYVPQGSSIHSQKLNNGIGQVVGYTLKPGITGSPVVVATPPFIDPEYSRLIENLRQMASDIIGVSQLVQASKKPSGLNSGVAIQSMEDIQSARLQIYLDNYIQFYVKIFINIMNTKEGSILPENPMNRTITWNEMRESFNRLSIQCTAADQISKDPQTKLQVLTMLGNMGAIEPQLLTRYLELPDLEDVYNVNNNVWNGVQTVIERCLEEDKWEIPPFVSFPLVMSEIVNCMLSLYVADPDGNVESINKLAKLFKMASNALKEVQNGAIPQ